MFSSAATKAMTFFMLLAFFALSGRCTETSAGPVSLANSTIQDNGHIHQTWTHPNYTTVVYRVILSGSGTSIPPPSPSTFNVNFTHQAHDRIDHHGNGTDSDKTPHPRPAQPTRLNRRFDVWKSTAHSKMYENKGGPTQPGTEAYWTFHTDSGGDYWLELVALARNWRLKWVNYAHNGCWLADCWSVQTQYEEWGYSQTGQHYDMQTQHSWIFWNGGSSTKSCVCITDCRKCDPY